VNKYFKKMLGISEVEDKTKLSAESQEKYNESIRSVQKHLSEVAFSNRKRIRNRRRNRMSAISRRGNRYLN
jgi:hypothetical protein